LPAPLNDQPCGAALLYSSGTTGRPKGIQPPLPDEQVDSYVSPAAGLTHAVHRYYSDMIYLCPAPLYRTAPAASFKDRSPGLRGSLHRLYLLSRKIRMPSGNTLGGITLV
jgi:hypothetical protein